MESKSGLDGDKRRYFGIWGDHAGMVSCWEQSQWDGDKGKYITKAVPGIATDTEVLWACYTDECYSGDARVIFRRDGKLWEATGSHCSCNGLEGSWEPGEVTAKSLAMRPGCGVEYAPPEAEAAWTAMLTALDALREASDGE